MAKIIKLEDVQNKTKDFYQICSDISIMQKELEQMLSAIEKNSAEFEKGRISKDLFRYNEVKMKKECARLIKNINMFVDRANAINAGIGRIIDSQRITEKKKSKKNRLLEIKRGIKKRKAPKSMPSENQSQEQKAEQVS